MLGLTALLNLVYSSCTLMTDMLANAGKLKNVNHRRDSNPQSPAHSALRTIWSASTRRPMPYPLGHGGWCLHLNLGAKLPLFIAFEHVKKIFVSGDFVCCRVSNSIWWKPFNSSGTRTCNTHIFSRQCMQYVVHWLGHMCLNHWAMLPIVCSSLLCYVWLQWKSW